MAALSAVMINNVMIQKEEWRGLGHGVYSEITEEKEFFDVCKKSNKVVCHFFRESTWRCKIVDKHLNLLAPQHLETRLATPTLYWLTKE